MYKEDCFLGFIEDALIEAQECYVKTPQFIYFDGVQSCPLEGSLSEVSRGVKHP